MRSRLAHAILTMLVSTSLLAQPYPPMTSGEPRTLNGYESCDISVSPAATLLLPFFEVDPSGRGENTLVTITNVSDTSIVAHAVVWSNWGFPVVDFNFYLTGYDVVSFSIRDLLVNGDVPGTGRTIRASGVGVRSRERGSSSARPVRLEAPYATSSLAETCGVTQGGDGAIPQFLLRQIQRGLSGGPYAGGDYAGGAACGQVGEVGDNMIGYITVDTSAVCATSYPTDTRYFADEIRWENQLIGDYIRLNDIDGIAGGGPLVHIKAIPGGDSSPTTRLPWTFYSAYQSGTGVADRRQPLPALFAARYIEVGNSFDTDFIIWREGGTDQETTLRCNDDLTENQYLYYGEIVRFDERENPTLRIGGCQTTCPRPAGLAVSQILNVNNRSYIPADPSPDSGGWIYFNLTTPEADPFWWGRPSQSWVQIRMTGAGRYGVDFDAAYLGNGCQYHVGVTLLDGGTGSSSSGEKIGPKYERGTRTGWVGN